MRKEPHWVKLFIRELERTGNVRIASERAGVDYTSAYQRRKRHAAFAEAWEGAMAAFAASPAQDGGAHAWAPSTSSAGPPPSAGIPPALSDRRSLEAGSARSGEEIVVRPDGKLIKGSDARWGKRAEEAFLTELTVSGSVRRAARAAGFSTTAIYKQRAKSRHFAAAWDAAVETGKARVQAYLVEAATRTFDPDELPIGDQSEISKVSISEAINIAKMGSSAGTSRGGKADDCDGEWVSNQEFEEARERIIERLQRLRDQMAEEERETGRCKSCGQMLPEGAEAGAE